MWFNKFVFNSCNKNNTNFKKYLIGEELIQNEVDLVAILKRIGELEKMKKILFDETKLDCIKIMKEKVINASVDPEEIIKI